MGVDVHEFLVKALQGNSRDRSILLKLEHDMVQFVSNSEIAFMKFPEMTSYHRMLVHRVAAYFGLDHNIDAKGKSVIINKTAYTRMPEKKFSDYSYHGEICSSRDEDMRRRSILKRMKNCQSFEHFKSEPHKSWKMMKQRSFEEREVNYEKIRARIFNEAEQLNDGLDKSQVGDLWSRKQWDGTEIIPCLKIQWTM
uniref:R3H domain-containing protein n=1 Tax=Ciona intestinalis TaxID=7719 RepID=H2XMJ2_CIOIN